MMFKLNFKVELSDVLLVFGIALVTLGIYFIFKPAALIFLGFSLVILAFLVSPKPKKESQKGGE